MPRLALKTPAFKTLYDSWKPFRDEEYLWFRVADASFETFVYAQASAPGQPRK